MSSTWVVFVFTGATFLWSALQLLGLRGTTEPEREEERRNLIHETADGVRAIAGDRRLQLVIGLFSAQTLVNGAMNVLIAVCALQLLDLGPGGVGYLNAAVGVGGLVGAFVSLALVTRRRLAPAFGLAIAGAGGPLLFVAPRPTTAVALIAFGLIGISTIVEDVAGFTILQRTTPSEVLARVFGILHSLFFATVALGAVLAPPLIHLIGVRWALVAVGLVLPVLAFAARIPLASLDEESVDRTREIELLRAMPMFAPLSAPVLEGLAVPARSHPGRQRARRSSARATWVTASTSSPRARSPSASTGSSWRRRAPETTSARSRSCATFPARQPSPRRPTRSCSRSSGTISSRP